MNRRTTNRSPKRLNTEHFDLKPVFLTRPDPSRQLPHPTSHSDSILKFSHANSLTIRNWSRQMKELPSLESLQALDFLKLRLSENEVVIEDKFISKSPSNPNTWNSLSKRQVLPSQQAILSSAFNSAANAVASNRASVQADISSRFNEAGNGVWYTRGSTIDSSPALSNAPPPPPPTTTTESPHLSRHNLVIKVVPAVVLGTCLLIGLLLLCFFCRRQQQKSQTQEIIRNDNDGIGATTQSIPYLTRKPRQSQLSFVTTESARIDQGFEPRTRWGRRSLVDVIAGGTKATSSPQSSYNNLSGSGSNPSIRNTITPNTPQMPPPTLAAPVAHPNRASSIYSQLSTSSGDRGEVLRSISSRQENHDANEQASSSRHHNNSSEDYTSSVRTSGSSNMLSNSSQHMAVDFGSSSSEASHLSRGHERQDSKTVAAGQAQEDRGEKTWW